MNFPRWRSQGSAKCGEKSISAAFVITTIPYPNSSPLHAVVNASWCLFILSEFVVDPLGFELYFLY
jgi:hypothetical protein